MKACQYIHNILLCITQMETLLHEYFRAIFLQSLGTKYKRCNLLFGTTIVRLALTSTIIVNSTFRYKKYILLYVYKIIINFIMFR